MGGENTVTGFAFAGGGPCFPFGSPAWALAGELRKAVACKVITGRPGGEAAPNGRSTEAKITPVMSPYGCTTTPDPGYQGRPPRMVEPQIVTPF